MGSFQQRYGWLFLVSTLGSVLSFGNQLVVTFHFGTSVVLDAYWALFAAVNFLLFYVQPLREALVPPVFRAAGADRERACALFSAGLAAQAVLALVSTALVLLAPAWVLLRFRLHEPGLERLLFGFLPFFVLFALAETCNGLLLSFNRAVYQAVARLASALIGLTFLWLLADRIGVLALVFSLLIAQFATLLLSVVGLQREGMRWVWRGFAPLWHVPRFRSVLSALLFTYMLTHVYIFVERVTMLGMQPGLVASYQNSVALVNVLITLLAFPLANLLEPLFLAQVTQEERGDADAMLHTAARVVAPLTLTLLACCSFADRFATEIVQVLFARGAFDAVAVAQTSKALRATVFAAIPISLFTIFGKILLSQGRSRAIATGGAGIALSGMLIVLMAGKLGSVALVQWHWFIGNTVGLSMVLFMLLHRTARPAQHLRASLSWLLRAGAVVQLSLLVTPIVPSVSHSWELVTHLSLSLAVFGAFTAVLSCLAGILDFRQILGRRS